MSAAERAEAAAVETLCAALSQQFSTPVTVRRAARFRGDPAFVAACNGRLGPLSYDGPLGALRALGAGHLPEVQP